MRRQELDRELQPNIEEVDAELRELNARIAAEQSGVALGDTAVADHEVIQEARRAEQDTTQMVSGIYDHTVTALLQGDRVQRILDERVKTVREKIPQLITEELNAGLNDLTSTLEGQLPGIGNVARMDDLPALSLMIAGLAAPTQLGWLHSENTGRIGLSAALLGMDLIAIGAGWDMKCVTWIFGYRGSFLRPWLMVDAASLLFTVLVRVMAMSAVNKTTAQMEMFQNAPLDLPPEPTMAFRMQLERQLLVGAQAMIQYDKIAQSPSFKVLDVLPAFDFIWQIGGIALLFDTPSQFCLAHTLMYWSRARGIIFLIGLLPAIISLALVIAKAAVVSRRACMAMLSAANTADKYLFPHGPAIVTLLVRAFLVRDTTDMQAMELQVMEFEKRIAHNERDRLKREYEAAEAEAAEHEEKYAAQEELVRTKSKEEEFLQQYQEAVTKVCHTIDIVSDPAAAAADAAAQLQASLGIHTGTAPTTGVASTGEDVDFDGSMGGTGAAQGGLGSALAAHAGPPAGSP